MNTLSFYTNVFVGFQNAHNLTTKQYKRFPDFLKLVIKSKSVK